MPAELLLAPAGSGKTAYLLSRIGAVKAADPLAPVFVILPNQQQAAEFRRRLAAAGGGLGVETFTFYGLYAEVLARAGRPIPALLDPVQIRLLRQIVDDLYGRGELRHYAALRGRPGFVIALRDAIQELKRARVFSDVFARAVAGHGARLEELAAVYSAYQGWLQRNNWADLEGRGWLAAIALEENPALGSELRLLAVSGFDEFNPTQLGVLAHLAGRAQAALISLTGDVDCPDRPAHRRFLRARQALVGALDFSPVAPGQAAGAPTFLAPGIAHLEAHLFEPRRPALPDQPCVEFIEAQNRAAEARAALRWVKARIVRDGLALGEVAIAARDLEPYRPFITEAAAEFGIPLRIIAGLPLAQNPAVAALLALLALPAHDWPWRPLLEAWRSPYFDWSALGIGPGDAAGLDAAARQGRVVSGLGQWQECFDLLELQNPPQNVDEEGFGLPGEGRAPAGELGGALRGALSDKFAAFTGLLTPPAAGTVREFVAFIEDLIGADPALAAARSHSHPDPSPGIGVVAQARANPATADRDVAALRVLKDVLRGLVLAEASLNSPPLEYAAFYKELRGAVEAATYTAPAVNGVLAASALNIRGLSFQAVALLGLAEGEFPLAERADPFLSEEDRTLLREQGIPLETRLRGDEGTFFYQAVTRARQRLLLTRPYLADDGQPWEPSPFWNQVHELLGKPPVRHVRPGDALSPQEAASPVEWLPPEDGLQAHIRRGAAILQARLARPAASVYEGELDGLAGVLAARYSAEFGWSASKLEAYGTCPFYFYVAYVLDLEPRTPPEEGYDVRMLGSMLHKILEDTYAQAADPGDLDCCLAMMVAVSRQVFSTAPADYGFRPTPLWAQQQAELLRVLEKTITALAARSQGFTPRYQEQKFGMGNPSLVLPTDDGPIRLHGYIDRVDAAPDGRLRVIDYKAGGAAISPRHLAEGRRLQLPLYALAARDALGLGEIAGGFYWHIQKAEPSSLKLEDYPDGFDAALSQAVEHVIRHVANIRAGKFQPQPPGDGCPAYCPANGFCWRYRPQR